MVRKHIIKTASMIKTPTLENLQAIDQPLPSSPESSKQIKRKTISKAYPVYRKDNTEGIHPTPPYSPPISKSTLVIIHNSISKALSLWKKPQIEKKNNEKYITEIVKDSDEWGYFVDLEFISTNDYLQKRFQQTFPRAHSLSSYINPIPFILPTLNEKTSANDENDTNFIELGFNRGSDESFVYWYDYGLLYTLVTFMSMKYKTQWIAPKSILLAIGLMSLLSYGGYSIYSGKNITD